MIQEPDMEIRTGEIPFASGTHEHTIVLPFLINKPVRDAYVALSGYEVRYTSEDHHVKRIKVMLTTRLGIYNGTGVEVIATLHLRDRNDDDPFIGKINFVLFVIEESRIPPIIR
ncbi:MAG: hypothetical protein ABIO91_01675 [Pyrinomonadaceae bacterium]